MGNHFSGWITVPNLRLSLNKMSPNSLEAPRPRVYESQLALEGRYGEKCMPLACMEWSFK